MRLELGSAVRCTGEPVGVLADLVIDPHTRRVTHLVVARRHQLALARLVPVELATHASATSRGVELRCTAREMHQLPGVHDVAYRRLDEFPVDDPEWDVGVQDVLALPDPDLPGLEGNPADGEPHVSVSYDRVPKGEVEIRRASRVTCADGRRFGRVAGLLSDNEDRITHLVLRRRRLLGRREVTLPIADVARVETDVVTLRLTKDEVEELAA